MRWNPRHFIDRLLWIRQYPVYREAPLRFATRAMAFTWQEQLAAPGDFEFTACRGCRFLSPPNNISSFIAATFGERDLNITRFWQRVLTPGAIFFDIGANIGLYTLPASRIAGAGGRVVAFEAHPATFRYLHRNVTTNLAAGIVIENLAVGAERGQASLIFNAANPGETHVATPGEHSDAVVATTTIDSYCREADIPRVDYIKIDVEGYEANVLRGAEAIISANDNILIQTEYEPRHMARYGTATEMPALLAGWGFTPHAIDWASGTASPIPTLDRHSGEIIWSRRPLPS